MTKNIEDTLKLALEALESCDAAHITDGGYQWYDEKLVDKAIDAIEEALSSPNGEAQPEQRSVSEHLEPVAWMSDEIEDCDGDAVHDFSSYQDNHCKNPLYTTPPQRKPLTRAVVWKLWCDAKFESAGFFWLVFARAIEAAHGIKEKNT